MSSIGSGDGDLHYSDGSHRWMCPDPDGDEAWRTRMEAHMERHQSPEVRGAETARRSRRDAR